mgnify:FL=1
MIDPNMPLSVQSGGLVGAAQQGYAFGQGIQDQKAQRAEKERETARQGARLAYDLALQLKSAPVEQRIGIVRKAIPSLQPYGISESDIDDDGEINDADLDQLISSLQPFAKDPKQQTASSRPVGNETIVDRNGTAYAQTRVFDPRTNKVSLLETALGPTSSIANRMGQTAEDEYTRALRLKREQEAIAAQNALLVASGQANIKLGTEGKMVPILEDQEKSKKLGAGMAASTLDIIDLGEKAAPIAPRIERGIELLNKVDTGGFDAQMKAIADYTGADTADASELQSIFSEQLLSQMQSMKGLGAMSEGDRKAIESGIALWGKSAEGNKRILKNYLSVLKRQKNNALQEIDRQGRDKFQGAYERIKGSTQEPTTSPAAAPKPAPAAKTEVNWGDL